MPISIVNVIAATLGASIPEVLFWHSAKTKLSTKKYEGLFRSKTYWLITGAMLAVSAVGSLIWFYGESQSPKNFLLAGAAFPVFLKKAISALGSTADAHLGSTPGDGGSDPFRDYVSIS